MNTDLSFADELDTGSYFTLPSELDERFYVMERLAEKEREKTFLLAEKAGGKQYVLKCYRKEDVARDSGEAELLRGLDYPGLPKLEADFDDGDTLFVLREYVEGVPLHQFMEGGLAEALSVQIIIKLCDILAYLHRHSIIHRDVTPANIIVDSRSGAVTLIDFGIARRYSRDALKDTVYLGKEGFAPPEQYGSKQTDRRSDLYSLAVVLRWMLTGSMDAPIKNRALARIVGKCTEHDPKDRYRTAEALRRALLRYLWRSRQKMLPVYALIAAVTVSLAMGFVAGFVVGRGSGPGPGLIAPNASAGLDEEYVFAEPLIEQAARLMLHKAGGEPITRRELREITELNIWGDRAAANGDDFWHGEEAGLGSIRSLEDLRAFSHLMTLHLGKQPVSDLTPLTGCKRLDTVTIISCDVADLSPLKEVAALRTLDVGDCLITDFSPIREMRELTKLTLREGTAISAIAGLGTLSRVTDLTILYSPLKTLEGIETMSSLETLSLSGTLVRDFSLLDNLPQLKTLHISSDMTQYADTLHNGHVEVIIEPQS